MYLEKIKETTRLHTKSLPFVFTILLLAPQPLFSQSDEAPSVETLVNRWAKWTTQLEHVQPARIEYSESNPDLREAGFAKENGVEYVATKDGFHAAEKNMELSNTRVRKPPFACQIDQPKYSVFLTKSNAENSWEIQMATAPRSYDVYSRADVLTTFRFLPGVDLSESLNAFQQYDAKEISRTDDQVTAELRIKKPEMKLYNNAMSLIDLARVTFYRDADWLPTRIDVHCSHIPTTPFWQAEVRSDWNSFDGILIPYRSARGEPENVELSPYRELNIKAISKITLADVQKQAKLSAYGLPELDLTSPPSRLRWYLLGLVLIIVTAFFARRALR